MSFFDKLNLDKLNIDKIKAGFQTAKERLTGEHGEITLSLDCDEAGPGEQVTATIDLKANVDFTINKVRLMLIGEETLEMKKDLDAEFRAEASGTLRTEELVEDVCGALELKEGDLERLQHTLTIPPEFQFSYQGEHCTHRYEIICVVDVAWAVDLKAQKPFKVLGAPPPTKDGRLTSESPLCKALLEIAPTSLIPGDLSSMKLRMRPSDKVRMEQVVVTFTSTEFVRAEIHKRRLPGSTRPEEEGPAETKMLPLVHWEETTSEPLPPSGAELATSLDFIIPENCLPTYDGKAGAHKVVMKVGIELEDQFKEKKTVGLTQDLIIGPAAGDGPAKMFLVWRG